MRKMSFGAVLAIVFGSQIGSGIFVVPSALAPFGTFSIWGWFFAGLGALLLAFVFADLCCHFPETGGPHVYVKEVFGHWPAFFTGWTYWLISWISSSVVVITAIACLKPFFGENQSAMMYLGLEIALLSALTFVNCKSVVLSGRLEFVLTILKFIPFVVVPAAIFQSFDISKSVVMPEYTNIPPTQIIIMATSIAFWCFIGVECATTPAEFVENPSSTIPKAIILGTLSVALIYLLNHVAIIGVIGSAELSTSQASFVDAINVVFGENLSKIISVITSLVCIGTLNAWILTSAQISLGLAKDGFLPEFFAKRNADGAPYISVLISSFGMVPFLILTKNKNLSSQIVYIIDFSVKSFLLVYLTCSLAYLKFAISQKKTLKILLSISAVLFCVLMICESSWQSILIATLFTVSGIFVMPFVNKPNQTKV